MPTKRCRTAPSRAGISARAIQAWVQGDFHTLNRELNVKLWQLSPFDVTSRREDERGTPGYYESWERAAELRRQLIEIAGPPGRVGRHGEPLGPARSRRADQEA